MQTMHRTRLTRAAAGVIAAALLGAVGLAAPASAQQDVPPECHASYIPCVPLDEDVDCLSGEGDGPVFIDYPVQVIGEDEYDLDRDGNGIGCEDETGTGPPLPEPAPEPEPAPQPEADPAPAASPATPVVRTPSFTG
jgi:hypothetical protein